MGAPFHDHHHRRFSPLALRLATAAAATAALSCWPVARSFSSSSSQQLIHHNHNRYRPLVLTGAVAARPSFHNNNPGHSTTSANSKYQNIVVLIGAGMSVSAGIPDFRTPGTGLYSKLEEYNLPYPEAIFELSYFKQNPAPFVDVAKAIWPGQKDGPKPTLAHSFVAMLDERNLLRRVYTQNIDGLERLAGVSDSKLIECHGHFSSCSCIKFMCKKRKNDRSMIKECQDTYIHKNQVMKCPDCGSYVKPDIVFFGEELPSIFMDNIDQDMEDCDLLLVMGTSLLVAPVASIPNWVGRDVPRILINRELVGSFDTEARRARMAGDGNYPIRDVFAQGDCDDGARTICELAGEDWVKQLKEIHHASSSSSK